tara:strand:+ start:2524 stop:2907 length:384 start_codon:yes stop_codon:yes gene_type:complete
MSEEKLQAGLLTDEVYLEKGAKSAANSYGESTNTWSSLLTLWAKVEYLSGSSEVKNNVEQKISKVKLILNWIDAQNLLFGTNDSFRFKIYSPNTSGTSFDYYYITEVKPIGFRNREFVEIYCKGRTN